MPGGCCRKTGLRFWRDLATQQAEVCWVASVPILRELRRIAVRTIYGRCGALTLGFGALWNRHIAVEVACPVHSQAYDLLAVIDRFSSQQR